MPKDPKPEELDQLVETWFVETFHNIGLPTELYNRFHAAKGPLKERLRAALTPATSPKKKEE